MPGIFFFKDKTKEGISNSKISSIFDMHGIFIVVRLHFILHHHFNLSNNKDFVSSFFLMFIVWCV